MRYHYGNANEWICTRWTSSRRAYYGSEPTVDWVMAKPVWPRRETSRSRTPGDWPSGWLLGEGGMYLLLLPGLHVTPSTMGTSECAALWPIRTILGKLEYMAVMRPASEPPALGGHMGLVRVYGCNEA